MDAHNPYTPPGTFVADITPPVAPMRKPVSIWLLQVACALPAIVSLVENVRQFRMRDAMPAAGLELAVMVATHAFTLLCAALFIWTIVAAQRRSRVAQWLAWIPFGFVLFIAYLNVGASITEPRDYAVLLMVLAPVLLLFLFATFSKRARAWYSKAPNPWTVSPRIPPAVEAPVPPPAPR